MTPHPVRLRPGSMPMIRVSVSPLMAATYHTIRFLTLNQGSRQPAASSPCALHGASLALPEKPAYRGEEREACPASLSAFAPSPWCLVTLRHGRRRQLHPSQTTPHWLQPNFS